MYQLVSAIVRQQASGNTWFEKDLSNLTLATIDTAYREVYLRVKSPFWTKDRTMLYNKVTSGYLQRDHTIAQFFQAIGNNTIESIDGLATIQQGTIKYADAYWAGYKLDRGNYLQSPVTIPPADDAAILIMSKPQVDGRVFHKNCLVTVNGLIHRVDADSQFIYVMQGGRSNYLSRRNEVGIINFRDIGELECHSITPEMLFKTHPDQPFANQVFIKAPASAEGKTAALVFGGYLHLLDNLTFYRTAEDIFCLDVQSISLLDRFFESKDLIDIDSLGIEFNGKSNSQISRAQLFSDEVMTKWLTLSQSFLVFIDSPAVEISRIVLPTSQLAKSYVVHEKPTLPLICGFGMIMPYWVQEDDDQFLITVGNNILPNRLYDTTSNSRAPMPNDNRIPYNPENYSRAHFLNIQSEKIVMVMNTYPEVVA